MRAAEAPRIVVIGARVPAVDGARTVTVAPSDVLGLRFRPDRDVWTVTTAAGALDYDLVVLPGTTAEIAVPALDPRVVAPSSVGPTDAERAYLGMLVDGVPNLVLTDGSKDQLDTLQAWLKWMYAEAATRILARPPVTARWIQRGRRTPTRPDRDAVDLSNDHVRDEGVYTGSAVLCSGDYEAVSPVRLAGHLEPLDGHYHWYGTVDDLEIGAALKKMPRGSVTVSVGGGAGSPAMVTDKTVWGTYRLVGVGTPPYPL
ncbi:DUF4873 domain-containing protein [Tsukamurella spumae]|uniref:DUF4873 domain-containing protein n=1 Tax=Tsukamurella spumae TaxID=44753 RepID=A0A846WVS1_9ACTN|nr:DUF4873 domain-containing protein [Tsukamurella spumae]NKY16964.1 DUF4873 domain-containing protein [Tsukamurella spumae]